MKFKFILIILCFLSILAVIVTVKVQRREIIIEKDENFFEPPYRISTLSSYCSLYSFDEQYFLYNYYSNEQKFDDLVVGMICNKLEDSILLAAINFSFLVVPWYAASSPSDEEYGEPCCPSTTYYYIWKRKYPRRIERSEEGRYDYPDDYIKYIAIDCDLTRQQMDCK